MTSTSQRRRTADEVVREILMDSDSEDGDCLSDNDPDFDDSDSESSSFEASLDLDLNQQRANNGPRPGPSGQRRVAPGRNGRGRGVAANDVAQDDWVRVERTPNIPPFTAQRGIQVPIQQGATPLDYFALLADDDFFDLLIRETNRFVYNSLF